MRTEVAGLSVSRPARAPRHATCRVEFPPRLSILSVCLGVDVLQLRIQFPRFVRPEVLSMPPTSSLFPAACRDDEVYYVISLGPGFVLFMH